MSITDAQKELAEVSKLRERLYWEFTRSKNAPPVPKEVTQKYYQLTEMINKMKYEL